MSHLSIPHHAFYLQILPWSCGYALVRKVLDIYEIEYAWQLPDYDREGTSVEAICTCLEWHGIASKPTQSKRSLDACLLRGGVAILDSKPFINEHVSLISGRAGDDYRIYNHMPLMPWRTRFSWTQIKEARRRSEDGGGIILLEPSS